MASTSSRVSGPTRVVELKDGGLDGLRRVTPEEVGLEPAADGAVGAGTPDENARVLRARARRASPAPSARWRVLNAGAAIYVGGLADSLARRASSGPRRRSTPAPRAASLERSWRTVERRAMSVRLDELVGATREAVRPAQARAAAGRARARGRRAAARAARSPRRSSRPGHVADRRAQAPLAVGRDDPRGRQLRRDRARLRARRRGRASRSSPRRPTSAARWTTCARRARPPSCRSCARTSRSTPTSSTRPRPPAPTRCCWWWARSSRSELAALYREARRRSTSTRSSRSTTRRSSTRRSRSTPT